MSTNYPGGLDDHSILKDDANDATLSAVTHATAHNNVADAIIAIETVLGVNPNGSKASVSARIAALETGSVLLAPTAIQEIAPTTDTVALAVKVGQNTNVANLFEARAHDETILAFIDHLGVLSTAGLKINGTALASSHLSDGKTIQKKNQLFSFTRIPGVSAGISGIDPRTALQVVANNSWVLAIKKGCALIQGTDDATQGMYAITQSADTTLTLGTHAPATYPRVDAIVVQYNDSLWTGRSPADSFSFVQVTGVETNGANLTNLNGKPALPASCVLLAYTLTVPGDSGVQAANVLDERTLEGPGVWGEDGHQYRIGVDSYGRLGIAQVQ